MNYIIYKDGIEENRIVADEAFCKKYYSDDGYSYEELPPMLAALEHEPSHEPTIEEMESANKKLSAQVTMLQEQQTFLEECLLDIADEVYA